MKPSSEQVTPMDAFPRSVGTQRLRRVRGWRDALPALLLATACAQPQPIPPQPGPPGVATFVSASFDLTWTAVLDHFATSGIAIATRDRSAGRIEAAPRSVGLYDAIEYADCGSMPGGTGTGTVPDPYVANSVVYSVEVGDNGSWSSVLATASWDTGDPSAPFVCETKGVWEAEIQEAVRLAAEANR